MDPHTEQRSGLGLPQPLAEQKAASGAAHHETHGRELHPISKETAPLPMLPPLDQTPTAPAIMAAPQAVSPQTMPIATGTSAASAPDDTNDDSQDALDEEWVSKAKAIVERTKSDPYVESKELSKAKADYLRVKYNKQIKVAEEQH